MKVGFTIGISILVMLAVGTFVSRFSARSSLKTNQVEQYTRALLVNSHILSLYISDLQAGKIERIADSVVFSPPTNFNASFAILNVSTDANSNIYFVTDHSFTMYNVGYVYHPHNKPLLGDGQEPTIVTNVQIADKWQYYRSR